ncbi:MAG: electron-transfer flavoprotein:ubiquinone oxidoreductase [Phycisphaerae bacterium]|jgi:electron-transferring-flavoprotein dehydrogenase
MTEDISKYEKAKVLIIGGGPAGLSAAIRLKAAEPDLEVCVIEKGQSLGNNNLSGAVLEIEALHQLLDGIEPDWENSNEAVEVLANQIDKDDVMFLLGKYLGFKISIFMKLANKLHINIGQMVHDGDYSISISRLTRWLDGIAQKFGVEILTGFAAQDIILDDAKQNVTAVKLVDQGLDKEGNKQPNFVPGEIIRADFVILAEGCDGLLTEKLVEKASLIRKTNQLYSVSIKELIKVNPGQYERFTKGRVIHAMGYPLWTPVIGPNMFGGGIVYAGLKDHLSVGMIVGADWKYCDFNPQDALVQFKQHRLIRKFIEGGTVVEAGAKMIPEGGYYAIPRDGKTGSIGTGNCMILGDSAGFVNMLKIKGLHNAIISGIKAAEAICETMDRPSDAAVTYTRLLDESSVKAEMKSASKFRQSVAKFGPLIGMPLSIAFGRLLPLFKTERDYETMAEAKYRLKPKQKFDKDTFTAQAGTGHREEQPSHLTIINRNICAQKCAPKFERPCITFCPAGVYETIGETTMPANPSNCVHCKTCQRKCPFDNIRWTVPEGGGGPRYNRM